MNNYSANKIILYSFDVYKWIKLPYNNSLTLFQLKLRIQYIHEY